MGYDERQQSNSSGALVAVIGAGLVLAILAIVAVAGVGLFWLRASAQQERAVAMQQHAIAEAHRAEAEARRTVALAQSQQARTVATPDPRLDFQVKLDKDGNISVEGTKLDLDELKTQLAKLKEESSNAFVVRIFADPDCPAKHIVPVLDAFREVGDVDYRMLSSDGSGIRITATVVSYEAAAEWDHFDDGTFSVYDTMNLKVLAPKEHAGKTLSFSVPPTTLPEDSAFRTAGARLTFTLLSSSLASEGLAWGAVENPTTER